MISAGDFKNGLTIELEGNVYQIVDFQHVKPGKGAAFVRTKMKNIKNGGVVEKTFRPTEKFPPAHIERTDMQYLYTDGDLYYFMDVETYDQIALSKDDIGDALKFVNDNYLKLDMLVKSITNSVTNKLQVSKTQAIKNFSKLDALVLLFSLMHFLI